MSSLAIRVLVNGAAGKMGQETVKALQAAEGLILVGTTGRADNLTAAILESKAQVVVDFTTAEAAFNNGCEIIAANAHPVIGSSGLFEEQVLALSKLCAQRKLGGLVIPNFSISAVLAMQYARDCSRYFSSVEIIELHHPKKADAPSGTAIRTAELIAQARANSPIQAVETEVLPGARGARYLDIPIHSVRLPGLLAHQEVMFGGAGELLTIRYDTTSREAFMPGVCLACRKVMALDSLVYGLEHIL